MKLTSAQNDRASGVMLAMACGDALGAGYEFGPPFEGEVLMKGGNGFNWAPGEWTDDTSMAIPILRAAASGRDLRDETVLDEIVTAWIDWAKTAPDVGVQTSGVLRGIEPTASAARASAKRVHDERGRSGGNGSLMRTAPVALAYLNDPAGLAEAARAISDLTHFDEDAGDACVLWCLAIRHAILTGEADVRVGLSALVPDRAALWSDRIDDAETKQPRDFTKNGWVVEALQAAWSAIANGEGLVDTLERAVRGGRDADTVAAIAGGLVGAQWGLSAIPTAWQRIVHGWPGLRSLDLVRLSTEVLRGKPADERIDYAGYGDISTLVQHPHDDGVWLGAVGALDHLPPEVDAVVSLCRIGSKQVPRRRPHRAAPLRAGAEPHAYRRCALCGPAPRHHDRARPGRSLGSAAARPPQSHVSCSAPIPGAHKLALWAQLASARVFAFYAYTHNCWSTLDLSTRNSRRENRCHSQPKRSGSLAPARGSAKPLSRAAPVSHSRPSAGSSTKKSTRLGPPCKACSLPLAGRSTRSPQAQHNCSRRRRYPGRWREVFERAIRSQRSETSLRA